MKFSVKHWKRIPTRDGAYLVARHRGRHLTGGYFVTGRSEASREREIS